jgi:hypothetical protein
MTDTKKLPLFILGIRYGPLLTFRERMLLNGSSITVVFVIIDMYFVLNGRPTVVLPLTLLFLCVLGLHYLVWRFFYSHLN